MKATLNTARLLVEIVAAIALAEATVTFILPVVAPGVAGTPEALLNAAMLSILVGPVIVWRVRAAVKCSLRDLDPASAAAMWRLKLAVVLVLILGLGGSGVVAGKMHQSIRAQALARFEALAAKASNQVRDRINQLASGLKGFRGLYLANPSVERSEFRAYVESYNVPREFPGTLGFGFIQRVTRTDLAAFTTAEQADQAPDFSVTANPVDPAGPGQAPDLYVIKFIEPREPNRGAWGFDIGSEALRRAAVERAVRTGEPTLTGRVQIAQNDGRRAGMLFMLAVYRSGTHPTTPEQREAALAGLVYAPIVLEAALADLSSSLGGLINVEIFDATGTQKSAQLFDMDGPLETATATTSKNGSFGRMFQTQAGFPIGGRTWTATLSTTPAFEAQTDSTTPVITALGGGALTVLGAAMLWTIGIGRSKALALAGSMTRELREAVARSERLAEIARRTSNAIIITDLQGRIEWANDGFTRNSGFTLTEALGKQPQQFLHGPETDPAIADRIAAAIRRGERARAQLVNYSKARRPYLLDIEVAPLLDAHGHITGCMAIQSDVTQQAEDKARIAKNEARFRTMVEGADVILWEYDAQADCFLYVSPQAAKLGYPLQDWLRPGFWHQHIHPLDRDGATKFCFDQLTAGKAHRFEYRMLTADGQTVWIDDSVSVPDDANGRTILRGVLVDITRRKRAEEAQTAATELAASLSAAADIHATAQAALDSLVSIADSPRSAVLFYGDDGVCRFAGWRELSPGYRTAVEGHCPWARFAQGATPIVVADVNTDESLAPYRELFAAESVGSLAFIPVETAEGVEGKLMLYDAAPGAFASGERLAGAMLVAKYLGLSLGRLIAQQRHESARVRAEAASLAKSEFLANMSHEIRTPLTAILGFADLLHDETRLGEPGHQENRAQTIDIIRNNGAHLLTVINDILDLSKIEAGRMTVEQVETPLVALLHEVVGLARPRAALKGVQLSATLATPLPDVILSDPTRLRQILVNLVGNAAKFTDQGSVIITAGVEQVGYSQRLVIGIADTGPGMTPQQVAQLFQPFSQADTTVTRKHGGTGLGLTICRRLAALMGGEVTLARSEPGIGSTFHVDLPLEPAPGAVMVARLDAVHVQSASVATSPVVVLPGRILLADDGADNQRLIAFHLRKAGATVDIACSGRVALEMIDTAAAAATPYDLLVTDMQMPEMDGYTLARTLRRGNNPLAIVALTAHAMSQDRQRCIDAGCDDYATKPIDKHTLLAVCAAWIGKRGGKQTSIAA